MNAFGNAWSIVQARVRHRAIHAGYFLGASSDHRLYRYYVIPVVRWAHEAAGLKVVFERLRERAAQTRRGGWGLVPQRKHLLDSLFVDWRLATLDGEIPRIDDPKRAALYWYMLGHEEMITHVRDEGVRTRLAAWLTGAERKARPIGKVGGYLMAIQFREDAGERRRKYITAVFYGASNVGKTSYRLPRAKPVIMDFDGNLENAQNRTGKPYITVNDWSEVSKPEPSDFEAYDTVIVDTAGAAIEMLLAGLLKDPKMRTRTGGPQREAWTSLSRDFGIWINAIKACGLDVILTAHVTEEQRDDTLVERMDVIGKTKNLIYRTAQLMGVLYIDEEGRRVIDFDPKHGTFRKNVGISPMVIKHPFYAPDTAARIIAEAKVRINEQLMRDSEEAERLTNTTLWVDSLKTVDQINGATASIVYGEEAGSPAEQRILTVRARGLGLVFYKDLKLWLPDDAAAEKERKRRATAAQAPPEPAPVPAPTPAPAKPAQEPATPAPVTPPAERVALAPPPVALAPEDAPEEEDSYAVPGEQPLDLF